ncbi:hypothetical protein ACFRAU_15125 [Arthrobacter sp. NPDC056691]|uniref:hypothetical protein n=1 Tax=unclassified Arthrobacter TaxID=235627 RepID=UPI00366CF84E
MKIRFLAPTVMACLILLVSTGCMNGPKPDLGARDATVSSVMQALHAADKDQLIKLSQPGPQYADGYAQMMISDWGGVKDSGYSTSYSSEAAPEFVAVRVSTQDSSGRPADVEFALRWNDRTWLLDIGSDLNRT